MVKQTRVAPAPWALLCGLLIPALLAAGCGGGGGGGGSTTTPAYQGTLVIDSTPPQAQVFINGADTGQRTHAEITREVDAAGTSFTVTLRYPGYEDGTATVMVKPGEAVPVSLTLIQSRPPDIPPHTITGKVLLQQPDGSTAPATAATVTAVEATTSESVAATLDTSATRAGAYYIFAPAGTYHVTATSTGYQPQARDVVVLSGEDRKTGIDFTLSP